MSYTQMVKQWERDYNKKCKIELKQWKEKQHREERINTAIICAELIEGIREQRKQEEIIKIKDSILLSLRTNNPFNYPQYLIIWDILNNNYEQIEHDLQKKKITKDDIQLTFNYINKFSNDIISQYWKEKFQFEQ